MVPSTPNQEPDAEFEIPEKVETEDESKVGKPSGRRWLPSFSLATVCGLLIFFGMGFAWIANNRATAKREMEILERLEQSNPALYTQTTSAPEKLPRVQSFYDFESDEYQWTKSYPLPADPPWLKSMMGGYVFERLSKIVVYDCYLESLDEISEFRQLKVLFIDSPKGLTDISAVEQLRDLQRIGITCADELQDLSSIGKLTSLKSLAIYDCPNATDLSWISQLKSLERLSLIKCPQADDLEWASELVNLKFLDLTRNENLADLAPLSNLRNLIELRVGRCPNLASLDGIAGMKRLELVVISRSDKVKDIEELIGLPNLKYIDIQRCSSIPADQLRRLRAQSTTPQIVE